MMVGRFTNHETMRSVQIDARVLAGLRIFRAPVSETLGEQVVKIGFSRPLEGGMRKMRNVVSVGLIVVFMGGVMAAEGHGPPPRDERDSRKVIEAVYIWRMTEELDLSEEQISKFFPKLKKLENAETEHSLRTAKAIAELGELLKSDKPSRSALKKKMDELELLESEFQKKKAKLKDEMRDVLSIEQQAKLVVFRHRFHKEMRKVIRDIRMQRHEHPVVPD